MLEPAKIPWLELALIPRMGAVSAKRLLDKFGGPENILKASLDELVSVEGISRNLAENIVRQRNPSLLDRQVRLIDKQKVNILTLQDDDYPDSLKSIYDPPLVLWTKGNILPDDYFSIAIVGTRLASVYGRQMSEKISTQLVEKGMTIVSGGARGIDTCAHQAALRIGGRAIAVLGCGLDVTYPLENKRLFERIWQSGALVSEFPLQTRPDRINFPMRNRIISGLSLGVVVIEAPVKSGALITVRHAMDQGREVFSVPGAAGRFTSQGTNQLLREGARLVEDADDILQELETLIRRKMDQIKSLHPSKQKCGSVPSGLKLRTLEKVTDLSSEQMAEVGAKDGNEVRKDSCLTAVTQILAPGNSAGALGRVLTGLSADETEIYNLVSDKSVHIDEIVARSKLAVGSVFSILMQLELKKLVRQLPGKTFVRI